MTETQPEVNFTVLDEKTDKGHLISWGVDKHDLYSRAVPGEVEI